MNTGTAENPVKVVLDTNIFISALVYGGIPEKVLRMVLTKELQVVISPVLQAELTDIITKKFPLSLSDMYLLKEEMEKSFIIVNPHMDLYVVRDSDDNRVLEAAVEGDCDFIITGDQDLLELKEYRKIKIVTPVQFLEASNSRSHA
ncbi:putative toxin-antitoxin system toxin component, PIN family [Candidatus Daviesbacteria bacterium]|nr:putative toxin-antitoxin system toxin component, PIN family [Candidatus Daviesbacteria bacterium]